MNGSDQAAPTIASDEDLIYCYVLADDHAPDSETAERVLIDQAREQWLIEWPDDERPVFSKRQAFKWQHERGEPVLIHCAEDDPAKDSEWWTFTDGENYRTVESTPSPTDSSEVSE